MLVQDVLSFGKELLQYGHAEQLVEAPQQAVLRVSQSSEEARGWRGKLEKMVARLSEAAEQKVVQWYEARVQEGADHLQSVFTAAKDLARQTL